MDDDDYVFVPALRRSLRLSVSARCSPLFGTDMMRDDQRVGWNGGVGAFTGGLLSKSLYTFAFRGRLLPFATRTDLCRRNFSKRLRQRIAGTALA
jgi:hypothetical protein